MIRAIFVLLLALTPLSASVAFGHDQAPMTLEQILVLSSGSNLQDRAVVRSVQRSLRAHGLYHGAIDGIAGPRTRNGLAMAQKLSVPWVIPVVRMRVRSGNRAAYSVAGQGYILLQGQAASVAPHSIYAPAAPWRLPIHHYGHR